MGKPYRQDRGSLASTVGDVPRMATLSEYDPLSEKANTAKPQIRAGGPGARASKTGRVNLAAVADVLSTYGMDPAEEIAKILANKVPVLDREGKPVVNPETGEVLMQSALDLETALKTQLELLQYTRPKLKAVEVTMKEQELTDEQIDKRLEALMRRNEKKG